VTTLLECVYVCDERFQKEVYIDKTVVAIEIARVYASSQNNDNNEELQVDVYAWFLMEFGCSRLSPVAKSSEQHRVSNAQSIAMSDFMLLEEIERASPFSFCRVDSRRHPSHVQHFASISDAARLLALTLPIAGSVALIAVQFALIGVDLFGGLTIDNIQLDFNTIVNALLNMFATDKWPVLTDGRLIAFGSDWASLYFVVIWWFSPIVILHVIVAILYQVLSMMTNKNTRPPLK